MTIKKPIKKIEKSDWHNLEDKVMIDQDGRFVGVISSIVENGNVYVKSNGVEWVLGEMEDLSDEGHKVVLEHDDKLAF